MARQTPNASRRLASTTATLGLVALVAGCADDTVTAQCVQDNAWWGEPVVVRDDYCTQHEPNDAGFFIWGGHQYRYYYGSDGAVGSRPRGGSITPPAEDEDGYSPKVQTKSGQSITRGGLGGFGGKGGYAGGARGGGGGS